MSRLELAWWLLFWSSGAVALLRWPARTLGLLTAVISWTAVGPWAAWASFGAVVLGAAGWRLSGRSTGAGLLGRPRLAACVLAAAVTVFAPGWWVLVGVAALVVSGWWLMAGSVLSSCWAHGSGHAGVVESQPEPAGSIGDWVADQAVVLVDEIEDFLRSEGGATRGSGS